MQINGTRHPEQLVYVLVETETIVLPMLIPALELHHELDSLGRAGRRHAEQIPDIDDAEAAQLHVIARRLGTRAKDHRVAAASDLDGVVGDQSMPADDEVQRTLTLADAAVADDEHAKTENVHEHAVDDLANRQRIIEQRADSGDGDGSRDGCAQQRHLMALGRRSQIVRARPIPR